VELRLLESDLKERKTKLEKQLKRARTNTRDHIEGCKSCQSDGRSKFNCLIRMSLVDIERIKEGRFWELRELIGGTLK